jgi:hypothetical protein
MFICILTITTVIEGGWTFNKADFATRLVFRYSLRFVGESPSDLSQPPSGSYVGEFSVTYGVMAAERDVELTFTPRGAPNQFEPQVIGMTDFMFLLLFSTGHGRCSVRGSGHNRFGRFTLEGSSVTSAAGVVWVILKKTYTAPPKQLNATGAISNTSPLLLLLQR